MHHPDADRKDTVPRDVSAPNVTSLDMLFSVTDFPTGWNSAVARWPRIAVETIDLATERPRSVSISLRKTRIKTIGLTFPELSLIPELPLIRVPPDPSARQQKNDPTRKGVKRAQAKSQTRIAPPSDIIKLEDRLYYLLQPPLETILASEAMHMPFEPFPYQYQGIAFLYSRYSAILADEMGLGKTMQAITAIRLLLHSAQLRSVLLICPKPLVTNWKREFTMWAPELPLCIIEGDQARRRWQWQELSVPIKIANYELLMRDREVVLDNNLEFDLVVLDEAQRIKNRSSTTSQITRAISRTRNWALTGTPVENSSEDLVGIFEFLSPGYLQSGMSARRMAKAAGDYILRRTKDKVFTDMPPKLYRDAELDLTPEQWAAYRIAEDEGIVQLEGMGTELTIQHVFELILRLKQICNFDPATGASSKLERLEADLEEVAASGRKAIVFSQWVNTLDKIRQRVARFGALEYHGKIPSKRRDGILQQFREDDSKHVILMSYGAGSVGLNLQFCRYVFLYDRWWNPAVEDQAINRAHRIGVVGSVTVTRMLTMNTIEERINQVLEEKRALFDIILSQTDAPASLGLTQNDVFGLFNLHTSNGPLKSAA